MCALEGDEPGRRGLLILGVGLAIGLGLFVIYKNAASGDGPGDGPILRPLLIVLLLVAIVAIVVISFVVRTILLLSTRSLEPPHAVDRRVNVAFVKSIVCLILVVYCGTWAVAASGLNSHLLNDIGLRCIYWRHEVRLEAFTSAWLSSENAQNADELVRQLGESVGCCAPASWNPSTRTVHLPFAHGQSGSEFWERGLVLIPSEPDTGSTSSPTGLHRIHDRWFVYDWHY